MSITFEGYDRRINKINKVLNEYGIKDIDDAKKICDDKTYRIYITEALKAIGEGKCMSISYRELIETPVNEPQRTSDDIISSICADLDELGEEEGK